jgi:hypothetical protein
MTARADDVYFGGLYGLCVSSARGGAATTAMNKFRKLGLISYNAHIKVNSALLDAVLRDKPELGEDE